MLVRILDAAPLQINVLLGPKDAGKSLLLTHLRELWKSSAGRSALAPLVIINMRINDCSSPDAMAALLRTELGGWQKQVRDLLGSLGNASVMGVPAGEIAQGIKSFWESIQGIRGAKLVAIQGIIQSFLAQYKSVKPVIIFDEANRLAKWEGVYDKELDELLGFMEGMTKQTGRAHVVMASSDEFFRPYQLKTLALNASLDNGEDATNLVAQAQDLIDVARVNLEMTLGLGEGWTPAELTGIFKAIVEGGGAAAYRTVVAEVFGGQINHANKVVRQQLVRSNIIHVRLLTKATKYRDVPAHHTVAGEYLMATSPAAYAAMKLVLCFRVHSSFQQVIFLGYSSVKPGCTRLNFAYYGVQFINCYRLRLEKKRHHARQQSMCQNTFLLGMLDFLMPHAAFKSSRKGHIPQVWDYNGSINWFWMSKDGLELSNIHNLSWQRMALKNTHEACPNGGWKVFWD
ncbi:hypothetical protein SELMODRAFT_425636 [Selaginella moellendorffii]|uniref:AAA+ ATPase domain-containing protein n=1 Tax=Selaginella moellendorffii TaxID=88036 RepID=D8STR7_SELML|nr:hypothetical protein SELMODRAFT_425636 [Selaginella moellendorffii]